MDQEEVLYKLYDLIEPNGGVLIIGTDPVRQSILATHKDELIKDLVAKYLGSARRAGSKIYAAPEKKYEQLLPNSQFGSFEEKFYDIKLSRNIDEIVGQLFSMSWAAKKAFW